MTAPTRPARLAAEVRRAQIEEAACRCLARGGFRDFTVDKITAEAGVSRGLILHHFGSMEGLLVAVYGRMYDDWLRVLGNPAAGAVPLEAILEALFSPEAFGRDASRAWIAVWDLIPGHPVLQAAHRAQYDRFRARLAGALAQVAARNGREADAPALAAALICLLDGFSLQRGLDPDRLSPDEARAACTRFLEPHVGPLAE
jgi:TetR/AcrR family transcriptional regulator, transcriptional repressor of bet genes